MRNEHDEILRAGPQPSPDEAQWQALEIHLRAVAEAAARFKDLTGAKNGDAAWLAGLLHDIGKARTAFQDLVKGRSAADAAAARPASRRFGAFAGKFTLGDSFFDPLPEHERRSWSGG